jgi:murein L,D-transpeptidase YafK
MIKLCYCLLALWCSTTAWANEHKSNIVINHDLSQRLWQALEKPDSNINPEERSILGATLALEENDPKKALQMLDSLKTNADPLANLLKAEAHRREALSAVSSTGDYAKHRKLATQQLAAIDFNDDLHEATVRLQAFADKIDGTSGFPLDILMLGSDVQSVFMVDKARSRLFVYHRQADGKWERVADEYVVTGAKGGDKKRRGDARTPNGVYRFTSIRHDPALRAKYGPVVFPIDYPNWLDKLHGKTGDGIWMHGYPESKKRRPPQDTRGCFALPNPVLKHMEAYVKPGQSWVIIGEHFAFGNPDNQPELLASVESSIQAWKKDWESLDSDAYLAHYHEKFRSGKRNLSSWKRYKKRVNAHKKYIHVTLDDMTIIHDPTRWQEGEVVVLEFKQTYQSSNYSDTGKKRLYLARDDEKSPWKILIEESLKP